MQITELRAQFEKVNFKKQYETEITNINVGISKETEGMIEDVVSKGK